MKLAVPLAGAVLLAAAGGVSAAQKGKPEARPKAAAKMPAAPRNPNKAGGVSKGGPRPVTPAQRLMTMTPEQREQVLEKFPPEQQARVREQLDRFDHLPPAQKERFIRQIQSLSALPPARQVLIRQQMMAMNQLPQDRVRPVRRELLSLLNMPEEDRATRLNSDEFKKSFSPEEQKILSDLSTNLPPDYPLPGRK